MGLYTEKISKLTNLELKMFLFESEPVSYNALVLMDFDPFETMTGIICKYVLSEIISEWGV